MLTKLWKVVRDAIDKWLAYDSFPPTVIETDERKIIVYDGLPPEANAMALAMFSRSPKSYLIHLAEVLKKGWQKFMAQFYVGYNHKSIGDCGSTTICVEGSSMLAAKAIQDNELYSGQEVSTRYVKNVRKVLNPLGTKDGEEIQSTWMSLYSKVLKEMVVYFTNKYPALPSDNPREYAKAIEAMAFDIARGFLPAGSINNVGWHTNLRQAWDHTFEMLFHLLPEVRDNANAILSSLQQRYPSSFNFKRYPEQDAFMRECAKLKYWNSPHSIEFSFKHSIDVEALQNHVLLNTRPVKTELPNWYSHYGQLHFEFLLDFGSYRDLQRHRSCTQSMPLLTTDHGWNSWYTDSLPSDLKWYVMKILHDQQIRIDGIEDPLVRQYYVAMGYNVTCKLTAELPSAIVVRRVDVPRR